MKTRKIRVVFEVEVDDDWPKPDVLLKLGRTDLELVECHSGGRNPYVQNVELISVEDPPQ